MRTWHALPFALLIVAVHFLAGAKMVISSRTGDFTAWRILQQGSFKNPDEFAAVFPQWQVYFAVPLLLFLAYILVVIILDKMDDANA